MLAETNETAPFGPFGMLPGTTRSLWAMIWVNGARLLRMFRMLDEFPDLVRNVPADQMGNLILANESLATRFRETMDLFEDDLARVGGAVTGRVVRDMRRDFDAGEFTANDFRRYSALISDTLQREMESVLLFSVEERFSPQIRGAVSEIFGDEVIAKFPDAVRDLDEAGVCLAVRRYTAVVFHLMLAMERVLRVLAGAIGADLYNSKGQFEKWSVMVSRIKERISQLPADQQDEWLGAHNLLWGVGKLWRNETMHPAEAYTLEEAEDIFNAVKAFMRDLARRA